MTDEVLKDRDELMAVFPDNDAGLITPQNSRELVEATSHYYFVMGASGWYTGVPNLGVVDNVDDRFDFTKSVIDDAEMTENFWNVAGFKSDVASSDYICEWMEDSSFLASFSVACAIRGSTADPSPTDGNYRAIGLRLVAEPTDGGSNQSLLWQNASTAEGFDGDWTTAFMYWNASGQVRLNPTTRFRFGIVNSHNTYSMNDIIVTAARISILALPNLRALEAYAPNQYLTRGPTGTVPAGS